VDGCIPGSGWRAYLFVHALFRQRQQQAESAAAAGGGVNVEAAAVEAGELAAEV
jgi:hypothetical protein